MKANLVYRGTAYQIESQADTIAPHTIPGAYRGIATLLPSSEPMPLRQPALSLTYRGSAYPAGASTGSALQPVGSALQPAL